MVSDSVLNTALDKIAEKNRVAICWSAKICPECGADIEFVGAALGTGFWAMLFPKTHAHDKWICTNKNCSYVREAYLWVPGA